MVELAADGLANKEIAHDALRHRPHGRGAPQARYAKLGIRSRAQLARRLSPLATDRTAAQKTVGLRYFAAPAPALAWST